jgi:hypothetical protein
MTSTPDINPHNVGGTAFGALTSDEMNNQIWLYLKDEGRDLQDFGSKVSSAVRNQFSSFTDVEKSNKYSADLESANLVGGALSVQPLFGRFIVANIDNAETNGTFRADGKNSHMYSSGTTTTLGSTTIDTVSGYDMNPISPTLPSSFFTPVKTWFLKFFPIFTDKRLVYIAIVEGCLILLAKYLNVNKQTSSEQIDDERDIVSLIQDNQEFEDWILEENRV